VHTQEKLSIPYTVKNQGDGAASGGGYYYEYWYNRLYLSADNTWDSGDTLLSTSSFRAMNILPGEEFPSAFSVTVPSIPAGTFYLIMRTDETNAVYESDETNNIVSNQVTITVPAMPDLTVTSLDAPASIHTQESVTVTYTVKNQGEGAAQTGTSLPYNDILYLSTDNTWDSSDIYRTYYPVYQTPPDTEYSPILTITIPGVPGGQYYLILKTDYDNTIVESNEENNDMAVPVTITVPDLIVTTLDAPASMHTQQTLSIPYTVKNQGDGTAELLSNYWYDWINRLYLSTDNTWDSGDTLLHSHVIDSVTILPGEEFSSYFSIQVPGVPAGTYFLIMKTDETNSVYESDETNNMLTVPITVTSPGPDLIVTSLDAPASVRPKESVAVTYTVKNQGDGTAQTGTWPYYYIDTLYFSTDDTWDSSDVYLTNYPVYQTPANTEYSPVLTITIPEVTSGQYFLILKTDQGNSIYESNEDNNVIAVPVTVTSPGSDLVVISLDAPASTHTQEGVSISYTIKNQGDLIAEGSWTDRLYLSKDETWDEWDTFLTQTAHADSVSAGGEYTNTLWFWVSPVTAGPYYLLMVTDSGNSLSESDETNNILVKPVTITVPDLIVTSLNVPESMSPNEEIDYTYTVKNQGDGAAEGPWFDTLYLSTDSNWDAADTVLRQAYGLSPVFANDEYTDAKMFTVPLMDAGTYYLLMVTDNVHSIAESDETNNVLVKPITITLPVMPDLIVTSLDAPASMHTQEEVWFSYTVKNQGDGAAEARPVSTSLFESLYLSTDETLDSMDLLIAGDFYTSELPAGGEYSGEFGFRVPSVPGGTYYLITKTDSNSMFYESDETNNILVKPVTITVPDLVITSLDAPASMQIQEVMVIPYTVKNQGDGAVGATPTNSVDDVLYLSTDETWDPDDLSLAIVHYTSVDPPGVAAGGEYGVEFVFRVPSVPAGIYYLIMTTDSISRFYESDETNNILMVPVTITSAGPDLIVTSLESPLTVGPNEELEVTCNVKNQGGGAAQASWNDTVVFSSDDKWDDTDTPLATFDNQQSLGPGDEISHPITITIPQVLFGSYYLLMKADSENTIDESNEENNILAQPVTVSLPDLVVTSFDSPDSVNLVNPQRSIDVAWTVKNVGGGSASGILIDACYLSDDEILDESDALLGAQYHFNYTSGKYQPVPAGSTYSESVTISFPYIPTDWYHYIIMKTDGWPDRLTGFCTESNEDNNTFVKPIRITAPDLVATSVDAPLSARAGDQITIAWTVKNQGDGLAQGSWPDNFWLSTDEKWDPEDTFLAGDTKERSVPPGTEYSDRATVTVPDLPSRTYFLLTSLNNWTGWIGDVVIYESNHWNNLNLKLITIGEEGGLSEVSTSESDMTADLVATYEEITGGTIQGDLSGTFNYGRLDHVTISSGPFSGNGFFRGDWMATLDGVTYRGDWQGASYLVPAERKIYLKGSLSGSNATAGKARGTVEGYLTESVMGSDTYDHYTATWKLGRLGDRTVSATLDVDGTISRFEVTTYPSTGIHVLATTVNGRTSGDYTEDVSTVMTHLQVHDSGNPYHGAGFSFISYTSNTGNGNGWTYDTEVSQDTLVMKGMFSGPLEGLVSGIYDGTRAPRTLWIVIERGDLALPPAPDLKILVSAPQRGSPGQEVDLLIEYRNDGLRDADRAISVNSLDPLMEYIGASEGAVYDGSSHSVAWDLATIKAKTNGYLWSRVRIPWGLPMGTVLTYSASISGGISPVDKSEGVIILTTARDPNIKYGPEGNVLPGQKLTYRIEYENEGEGIAFGVYFTDTLDVDLDASTLEIGPVIDVKTGSQIAPAGYYNPATRTITWPVGEVGSNEGGYAEFSVNVKNDAPPRTEIINFGTVYFPSVPETTRTNAIISVIPAEEENKPPDASAGGPYEVTEGFPVHFDASASSDPEGTALQYRWDFTNDGTWDTEWSPDPKVSHTWTDDYTGVVNLEVSDGVLTSTDIAPVMVKNVPPVVTVAPSREVIAGNTVRFNVSFTDLGYLDSHTAVWDFGDSTSQSGKVTEQNIPPASAGFVNGSHVFSRKGVYTVKLTVTDDDGGSGTTEFPVTVKPIPATVRIFPKTLNLASRGIFGTFVTVPKEYNVQDITISTVVCSGAPVERTMTSKRIPHVIGFIFRKDKLQNVADGDKVTLTLSGKIRYAGGYADFEGSDTVKVIKKQMKGIDESEELLKLSDQGIFEKYNK
jgi:uncharacterized repeat protein (TIGR01451 family)